MSRKVKCASRLKTAPLGMSTQIRALQKRALPPPLVPRSTPGPCPPLPSGPAGLTRDGRAESGAKQAFDLEGQSAQRVVGTIMQYSRQLEMKAQLAEAGLDKTKLATVHK